jgi:hypothetical protein
MSKIIPTFDLSIRTGSPPQVAQRVDSNLPYFFFYTQINNPTKLMIGLSY